MLCASAGAPGRREHIASILPLVSTSHVDVTKTVFNPSSSHSANTLFGCRAHAARDTACIGVLRYGVALVQDARSVLDGRENILPWGIRLHVHFTWVVR